MSSQFTEIDLNFKGYYSPTDPAIPEKPDIYCIYSTKPSSQNGTQDGNGQSNIQDGDLVELLYIGQSGSGEATRRSRIKQHANQKNGDYPVSDQYLYSFVELRRDQLDMVENALVFQFTPPGNEKLKDKYTHSDVDITVAGSCAGLEGNFRLYNGTERF